MNADRSNRMAEARKGGKHDTLPRGSGACLPAPYTGEGEEIRR